MSVTLEIGPAPSHYEQIIGDSHLFEVQSDVIVVTSDFQCLLVLLKGAGLINYTSGKDLNKALQEGLLRRGERWEKQSEERARKLEPIRSES